MTCAELNRQCSISLPARQSNTSGPARGDQAISYHADGLSRRQTDATRLTLTALACCSCPTPRVGHHRSCPMDSQHSPRPTSVRTEVLSDFSRHVERKSSTGCDLSLDTPRPYLSRKHQREFWTRQNVLAALRAQPTTESADVKTIQNKYLGVFSLLVYCDRISYLKEFFLSHNLHDSLFPLSKAPGQWSTAPFLEDFFELIKEHQYRFFPLVLSRDGLVDHHVPPGCILPITEVEVIHGGDPDEASVYKIKVDPEYNELVSIQLRMQGTGPCMPQHLHHVSSV